jgi:chromosome segregation ATPase
MECFNPCRPHSLRAAFISQLTGKTDRVLIEFWAGHNIGEEKRTYLNMPTEELRELYMDAEKYLAIEKTSRDEVIERKTVKTKVTVQLQKELQDLKGTLQGLTKQYNEATAENLELKSRISKVELEITSVKKAIEKLIERN